MNNGVADLISPVGRALQTNMQQMTPDQFTEMAKQYVANGLLSWSDLLSIKSQYDRMKQAPQGGPPPTTTVVQDMQQQMGGGLASLPSNIGNEASYARGGVVAFAGAGSVGPPRPGYDPYAGMGPEDVMKWDNAPRRVAAGDLGLTEKQAEAYNRAPPKEKIGLWKKLTSNPKAAAKALGRNVYLPGVALTAWGDVLDPVPTENMREYYRDKGLTFIDPVGDSLMGDLGVRALGTTQRALTWGMTGPQRDAAPPSAGQASQGPPPGLSQEDLAQYFGGASGPSGSAGIASLVGRPDLSGFDDIRARLQAREAEAAGEMDKGRMGNMQDVQAELAQLGIGNAAKEGRERLAKQEADLTEDTRRGKWLSAAEGFFGMAEAAGQGGTFMGAAAAGGTKGLAAYNKLLDQIDRKKEQLDEKNFQLAQLEEQQTLDAYGRGDARYEAARSRRDKAKDQLDALSLEGVKMENEFRMKELEGQIQQAVARIYAGNNQQLQQIAREYQAAAHKAFMEGNVEAMQQILGALGDIMVASSGAATVNMYKAQQNPLAGIAAVEQGGLPPQAITAPGGISFVGSRPE